MSRKNRKARQAAYVQPIDTTINTAINAETSLANNGTDKNGAWVFRQLSSAILETDASYQRPIDAKRVEHIVANYDWRLVNALKVSHRDGHYYVFDGAHTLSCHLAATAPLTFVLPKTSVAGTPAPSRWHLSTPPPPGTG